MKERLVLWVIEDESKGRELRASNNKLNTAQREYNPFSKDIHGGPEPTWLYERVYSCLLKTL